MPRQREPRFFHFFAASNLAVLRNLGKDDGLHLSSAYARLAPQTICGFRGAPDNFAEDSQYGGSFERGQ